MSTCIWPFASSKFFAARQRWINAALFAAAAVSVVPQQADAQVLSQARAGIGNLYFNIYDATPLDGVGAVATFLDEANAWRTQVYMYTYRLPDVETAFEQRISFAPHQTPLMPSIESVSVWPEANHGAAGGSWTTAMPRVHAQGVALARGVGFDAFSGLSTSATEDISPTFYNLVLGPGTGVKIGGYARVEAWLLQDGGPYASAYAELLSRFSPRAPDGSFQDDLMVENVDFKQAYLDQDSPLTLGQLTKTMDEGWLTLQYENLSTGDEIGRVRFSASAYGESMQPVPEPATLFLLAFGLLFLWAVRRFR